jgi:hypothetical protein
VIESRRRAYLEALGFDVWVARPPPAERGRLQWGANPAGTLLVCAAPEESATKFAADLVRALGGEATWAWPDTGGGEGVGLAEAIAGHLVTRVILFGPEVERWLFFEEVPEVLGTAAIAAAPALDELAVRGRAKQSLWRLLGNRMAARPA